MVIHNLPAKHVAMLNTMWELDDDEVVAFIKSLPYKDMRDAAYLIDVIQQGGDEITDTSDAKIIIDKIQKL
jgi:hypothetical protein